MSEFQLRPELPINENPSKPSDYLGHMSKMLSDMMADIDADKEIPLFKKMALKMAMMQLRTQVKDIHAELNPKG